MNIYNKIKRYYDALLKKYQIIWSVGLPAEAILNIFVTQALKFNVICSTGTRFQL